MKIDRLLKAIAVAALAFGLCFAMAGCSTTGQKNVELTPTVDESALITPGTLTVGVDSTFAPFGGESKGKLVGVDVDVAAALATELGLELQVVDVAAQDVDAYLADGKVDVVMNISNASSGFAKAAPGNPYVDNAAALFTKSAEGSTVEVDLKKLGNAKIGAYKGSVAATLASQYCDSENLKTYTSLSSAFEALESGEVDYVAADAVAGGYLSTSYNDIVYAASLDTVSDVFFGVKADNATLLEAMNGALATIQKNGVLETILIKWVGHSTTPHVMLNPGDAAEEAGN
ncbi:MAG: ABC transporter substrate-binding protein [bacterium]|nr:ABC transporter substrate-binding protein [bacterium]